MAGNPVSPWSGHSLFYYGQADIPGMLTEANTFTTENTAFKTLIIVVKLS